MTASRFRAAVGFGGIARGGLTRRYVSTLADGGPGSLREAATLAGSWVSFEPGMAGTIMVPDAIDLAPDVRIDGTGANITLTNGGARTTGLLLANGNNVVRNLTFSDWGDLANPTETQPFPHPIYITGGAGYVLDHLTVRNNGGKIGITCAPNVTVAWCHFQDCAKGIQIGNDSDIACSGANRVTIHHSWFERVGIRSPRIKAGYAHLLNNLIDHWGEYGVYALCGGRILSEANTYRPGADPNAVLVNNNAKGDAKTPACTGDGCVRSVGDVFESGAIAKFGDSSLVEAAPYAYTVDPTTGLAERIMASAGA